jgi:A/G-specific adenine glycosylase
LEFSKSLLEWYNLHARSLPWRGSRDPYVIWVSEIIFQQTRIEQGTGYYLRFVHRFPDVQSLAEASEDEVLRLWQGLGYYSRARNMLFTARHIMENLDGNFPSDFDQLLKLKGVGDYTASCIASICFGQKCAAVDGNVYRVLSRVYASEIPIDSPAGKAHFKQLAQQLISPARPGDFNEALMDLGATVCKPRSPSCPICPLRGLCKAAELNTQNELPVKSPLKKRKGSVMNYLLFYSDNHIIIQKRTGKGIWNGLYQLPMVPGDLEQVDVIGECEQVYGININEVKEVQRVKHVLTHADLDLRFFVAQTDAITGDQQNQLIFIPVEEIQQYPFPKPLVDFLKRQTANKA